MARVLPYVPSPLEQLIPYIGQAGQGAQEIGKKVVSNRAAQQLKDLENEKVQSDNNTSSVENLPQNSAELSPSELIRRSKLAEKAYGSGADKAYLDAKLQEQKIFQKEAAEIRKEQRQKKESSSSIQRTFDTSASLLAKNAPGIGFSPGAATGFSRKAVENRNFFNGLRSSWEAALLPLVNKGALSQPRFEFILSQIPEGDETQRAIAGKLRGLASSLAEEGFPIDTKILDEIPWVSEDLKNVVEQDKAVEKGAQLTEDVARDLLKKSGGNKEKARKLAKKMGYEF